MCAVMSLYRDACELAARLCTIADGAAEAKEYVETDFDLAVQHLEDIQTGIEMAKLDLGVLLARLRGQCSHLEPGSQEEGGL